jgi:hypothetical protein
MTRGYLAIGLVCALAFAAFAGVGSVSASGDQCQMTHGEDEGYYDENNNNPFDDDEFPGQSSQNRTGVA